MRNQEIAQIFREIAQILEIKGENVFRIRAYQRAAQSLEGFSGDLAALAQEGRLQEIPGIGKDLSEKIKEYLQTGQIHSYQELKESLPEGLVGLLNIPSLGPKTAKLLYEKLKIKGLPDLEVALAQHKLEKLFGIKEKTVENILKGITLMKQGRERMTLAEADALARRIISTLGKLAEVEKISPAGSLRRQKETVRDIDLLVVSRQPAKVMDTFTRLPETGEVLAKGETKSSLRTKAGVQVDCRVVAGRAFGAALVYFTGAKNFNIKLRQLAIKAGLKVNEYGVFKGERFIAGKSEEEVFKALGLKFIPPELREDNGEIELAREGNLPKLIELREIKGDLHIHSQWSDGELGIAEIAAACRKIGYAYAGICDHSQSLKIANGLSRAALKEKKSQIEKINKRLKDFRLLFGTEVDIDAAGNLDYPDSVLKEFDIVIAAIHSGFKQSPQQLTKRLIRACQNKYVHCLAHPTGRLWGVRQAYEVDFRELFKVARDSHTHLEINAYPERLDLNDLNCRQAKAAGIKLVVNSDAHRLEHLAYLRLGVSVARRGWLGRRDVINTLPLESLLKELEK